MKRKATGLLVVMMVLLCFLLYWADYFLCICRQSAASYIVKTKSGYYLFVLSASITD